MTKQVLVLVVLLCVASLSAVAQKADMAFVAGATFTSDTSLRQVCTNPPCFLLVEGAGGIHPDHRIFLEGDPGVRLLDAKLASLHLELPVVGIPSQPLHFTLLGSSSPAFDHLSSVYVTPALKIKLLPAASFSPWGSIGGGVAHFSSDVGPSTNKGALQFGGGVDIKTNIPLLGFRAEVRDFVTGDPHFGLVSIVPLTTESGLHRHNILVGGGVVLRF